MKNAILIADYANDSLTVQELRSTLLGHLNGRAPASISFVSSSPNTINSSYLLKQILITEEHWGDPNNLVLFVSADARTNLNTASPFLLMKHRSGAWVCGPNAGYSFSMIRTEIAYLYKYPNLHEGAQLRSRDLYMRLMALLMMEQDDTMELEDLHQDAIPALTGFYVGHVDTFGTLKTTVPHSFMKGKHVIGSSVSVTVGDTTTKAFYTDNLFGFQPGALVIAPGSSGSPDDPLLEIGVWEHLPLLGARKYFQHAAVGLKVQLV